jgi:hypothetical protein
LGKVLVQAKTAGSVNGGYENDISQSQWTILISQSSIDSKSASKNGQQWMVLILNGNPGIMTGLSEMKENCGTSENTFKIILCNGIRMMKILKQKMVSNTKVEDCLTPQTPKSQ